jgi:hypothetical protein
MLYAGRVLEQGLTDEELDPPLSSLLASVDQFGARNAHWLGRSCDEKREMAIGIARGVEITAQDCLFYNRYPIEALLKQL